MRLVDGRYVDEEKPEQERLPEFAASGREPAHVNRWLVVALVVAIAAVAVLAGLRYLEGRQTPDEQAVAAVVARNTAAWDRGDSTAVLQTMTAKGTWSGVEPDLMTGAGEGPYSGVDLAAFVRRMDGLDFRLTTTGPITILKGADGWTAIQPIRIGFRGTISGAGTMIDAAGWYLLTVVDDQGTKLISRSVFWPSA